MFFNSDVAVTRQTQGGYNNDGIFVDGLHDEFEIRANVQPLNQRETEQYLHILPGGNRSAMLVKIYTNEILLTDVQTIGQKADILEWNNRRFKIVMVEEWQSHILSHYRYIGQELIQSDNN